MEKIWGGGYLTFYTCQKEDALSLHNTEFLSTSHKVMHHSLFLLGGGGGQYLTFYNGGKGSLFCFNVVSKIHHPLVNI